MQKAGHSTIITLPSRERNVESIFADFLIPLPQRRCFFVFQAYFLYFQKSQHTLGCQIISVGKQALTCRKQIILQSLLCPPEKEMQNNFSPIFSSPFPQRRCFFVFQAYYLYFQKTQQTLGYQIISVGKQVLTCRKQVILQSLLCPTEQEMQNHFLPIFFNSIPKAWSWMKKQLSGPLQSSTMDPFQGRNNINKEIINLLCGVTEKS